MFDYASIGKIEHIKQKPQTLEAQKSQKPQNEEATKAKRAAAKAAKTTTWDPLQAKKNKKQHP